MSGGETLQARDFAEINDVNQLAALIELEEKERRVNPTKMHDEALRAMRKREDQLRHDQQN